MINRNTKAIFTKQIQSLLRNPGMLIQALIYVGLVLVLSFLIGGDDEIVDCDDCIPAYICEVHREEESDTPDPSMAGLFTVMFVGMTLVGSASALVLEDKTTQNLRFMTMAGVKPSQYLLGTTTSLFVLSFFR